MVDLVDSPETVKRLNRHRICLAKFFQGCPGILHSRWVSLNILYPLVVGLEVTHLLDGGTVVFIRGSILDVLDEVLGLDLIMCTGVDVIVLDEGRELLRLATIFGLGELHLLGLEDLLFVPLRDYFFVLPVLILLICDGVTVYLHIMTVSEH